MNKGCIHLYCGDGKGKTSAALGLLLRAAGAGLRVTLACFLKSGGSSEFAVLDALPAVTVLPMPAQLKFLWDMTAQEKAACRQATQAMWQSAIQAPCDVLILDELCGALEGGMLEEEAVLSFLRQKPPAQEIVITGRTPSPALVALSDYVSQIRCVRHPFDQGQEARKGIEY